MNKKILIIEDEEKIAKWIQVYFQKAGFETLLAFDGLKGLEIAENEQPDLVILDLMLPVLDGIQVCKMLREESDVPIIMLTAKSKESDRINGLEAGADDYVIKPFSPAELVARARAILRRVDCQLIKHEKLIYGEIQLDVTNFACRVNSEKIRLSRIQFELLLVLMRHPDQVFSRQQLMASISDNECETDERTIDVHIRRLRQRIEKDPSDPRYIHTVFGVGYKFGEPS
jgi:DNA-binding response OmpR family regulator